MVLYNEPMLNKLTILVIALAPIAAFADATPAPNTTYDCSDDGVVNIDHDGGWYTLKGVCSEININGSGVHLTVEQAGSLAVNGSTNSITLGQVGTIVVNGD